MLGIQISSINGIENISEKKEENKVANTEETTNGEIEEDSLENNSEALEPGTKTEIITRKCKNKK